MELLIRSQNRKVLTKIHSISIEEKNEEAASLKYCYNGDFIMENEMFKIEPINSGIVIYEMPKE